ncbi:MAG TPA: molybdenum cofactor guanylyltransferase [Gammaproteobacteria bacterium]|nr:molybdenum cofactor guanylyltransferase [Gammaproteobacteria bacterium]
MDNTNPQFSCIILAGGEGKRVDGRDKGLIDFKGKPLVNHVINTVKSQASEIVISANRNIKEYEAYGYRVVSDSTERYYGPLAGIAAALPFCRNEWVLIIPCDMPFLPVDIIEKLSACIADRDLCIAEVNGRLQLVLLIHKSLLPSIERSLQDNQLRLMQWVKSQQPAICPFSEEHYFKNFNHAVNLSSL